jgi:hypothetical protein
MSNSEKILAPKPIRRGSNSSGFSLDSTEVKSTRRVIPSKRQSSFITMENKKINWSKTETPDFNINNKFSKTDGFLQICESSDFCVDLEREISDQSAKSEIFSILFKQEPCISNISHKTLNKLYLNDDEELILNSPRKFTNILFKCSSESQIIQELMEKTDE